VLVAKLREIVVAVGVGVGNRHPILLNRSPFTAQLRLAVAAYLARFKGTSREHTESDLRCYLSWCAERGLDPLTAHRPHLELYIRWMQEIPRFKPSTVSRRFSVVAGFYRTCALDGIVEHSPAEHVRRPGITEPVRLRAGRPARPARLADLRKPHARAGPARHPRHPDGLDRHPN